MACKLGDIHCKFDTRFDLMRAKQKMLIRLKQISCKGPKCESAFMRSGRSKHSLKQFGLSGSPFSGSGANLRQFSIGNPFEEIGAGIKDLAEDALDGVVDVATEIGDAAANNPAVKGIENAGAVLKNAGDAAISEINQAVGDAVDGIADLAGQIESGLIDAGESVKSGLSTAVDEASSGIGSAIDAVSNAAESVGGSIGSGIVNAGESVASGVTGLVSSAKEEFEALGSSIKGSFESLGSEIASGVASATDDVKSSFEDMGSAIESTAGDTVDAVETGINQAVNTVKSGVVSGVNEIVEALESAWGAVIGALESAGSSMLSKINALGETIFAGLKSAGDFIWNDVAKHVLDAMLNLLGLPLKALIAIFGGIIGLIVIAIVLKVISSSRKKAKTRSLKGEVRFLRSQLRAAGLSPSTGI